MAARAGAVAVLLGWALFGCDDEPAAGGDGAADARAADARAADAGRVDAERPDGRAPGDAAVDDGVDAAVDGGLDAGDGGVCEGEDGRWQGLDPLGTGAIQEVAVAALHGEMYVIGGFDDAGRILPRVSVYDPENDAWRLGAPLPQAMHHANAAAAGGRLWVLGFLRDRQFNEDGRGYVYDPETEAWSEAPSMPDGFHRGAAGVAAIGDVVYVVGGLAAGQATSAVHAFDTVSGAWRRLPDLPGPPRDHMAAAAVDGLLVVAGGRDGRIGAHVARVDVFDPVSETWRRGADMPTSRGGVAAAAGDGRLYVIGGEGDPSRASGVFPQVEVYDVACDRWRRLGEMPDPRHGTGAAVIEGWLYVPGGAAVQAFGAGAVHARLRVE